MKKIIIVSDNHFDKIGIDYIKNKYKDVDYFFHCGDSDMKENDLLGWQVVCGNHDQHFSSFPKEIIIEVSGYKFMIVHGHNHGVYHNYYDELVLAAKKYSCDVVCFGHIHRYVDTTISNIRLLNPGSICYPRDGFDKTYMYVEINDKGIKAEKRIFKIE